MKTHIIFVFLFVFLFAEVTVQASEPVAVQIDPDQCGSLPSPSGNVVNVATEEQLWTAVNAAQPGDTILLADGTYHLAQHGRYVCISTPNVTLRSASGNREALVGS